MPMNDYLVPLLTCTLTDAIVRLDTMLICCCLLNTIIVIIIEFWDFSWSLLCCTLVSVLVSPEANIIGYWILGAFLGIVLTLVQYYKISYCISLSPSGCESLRRGGSHTGSSSPLILCVHGCEIQSNEVLWDGVYPSLPLPSPDSDVYALLIWLCAWCSGHNLTAGHVHTTILLTEFESNYSKLFNALTLLGSWHEGCVVSKSCSDKFPKVHFWGGHGKTGNKSIEKPAI